MPGDDRPAPIPATGPRDVADDRSLLAAASAPRVAAPLGADFGLLEILHDPFVTRPMDFRDRLIGLLNLGIAFGAAATASQAGESQREDHSNEPFELHRALTLDDSWRWPALTGYAAIDEAFGAATVTDQMLFTTDAATG